MASLHVSRWTGLLGVVALMACGATDHSDHAERTSTSAAAVTTYEFQVTLPGGTSIVSTTVGASDAVLVDENGSVLGPVASGGTANVETRATTMAITASADVDVDQSARVNGNIVAGGAIDTSHSAHVHGTETPFSASTAPYLTTWSVATPGTSQGPITLAGNAIGSPSPGVYDAVSAQSGSKLYLRTGTYYLQSLDLEKGATLIVDSRHGPVFVYLADGFTFLGTEQATDSGAPQLFVGDFGTTDAIIEAPFTGILLAPSASVKLRSPGHSGHGDDDEHHGQRCSGRSHEEGDEHDRDHNEQTGTVHTAGFYGKTVSVGCGQVVEPAVFDWQEVPGMPAPPGGWLANGGATGRGGTGTGTTGGTGNGGTTSFSGTIPSAGININVTVDPQTGSGSGTPASPPTSCVPFELPAAFDVGGELANGTVTIGFTSTVKHANTSVSCTYRGGAPTANPTTALDLNAGRTATFESCTDGLPATHLRCGSGFNVSVNAPPGWPVTVHLALDSRTCDSSFEILTPYQTRKMHDSFHWPDPNADPSTLPLVSEINFPTGQDPTLGPALYYAWVYVKSPTDMLMLRKLYVHMLPRPLFTDEITPFAGKCGTFTNPGDGEGQFIPVLMPGKVYNRLMQVQNVQYQQQNNLDASHGSVFFDAVILRTADVPAGVRTPNGGVSMVALAQSGFHYLDYEAFPLPSQSDMQLDAGSVNLAAILVDLTSWFLDAVHTIGQDITDLFGFIDTLISGKIKVVMTLHSGTFNTNFGTPSDPMIRAWGPGGGAAIGAGGLTVTVQENTLGGLIPETFSGTTNDDGWVAIFAAKHDLGSIAGVGLCIHLANDAARFSDFLQTSDMCDYGDWTAELNPNNTSANAPAQLVPNVASDQDLHIVIGNAKFSVLYQMADTYFWSKTVVGYQPSTAHVLWGGVADALTIPNKGRAFTACFHLRNIKTGYLDPITTGLIGGFADIIGGLGTQAVVDYLQSTDIIMPDSPASSTDPTGPGREVGSHEYGHFLLCNMAEDQDVTALDGIILGTAASIITAGGNDNLQDGVRYINEAFADYVSGQVTSIANYHWLVGGSGDSKICSKFHTQPCYDQNQTGQTGQDVAQIGRIATLIHDAFDGNRFMLTLPTPNDADAWEWNSTTNRYQYNAVLKGSFDSWSNGACRPGTGDGVTPATKCVGAENVALDGGKLLDFAKGMIQVAGNGILKNDYLNDPVVYKALDSTMANAGQNWCQRCDVLALHTSANTNDSLTAHGLLEQCGGSNADTSLVSAGVPSGSPPDPDLRIDVATCTACPPGQVSDDSGVCVSCPSGESIVGNQCVTCNSDVVISGTTDPFSGTWETSFNNTGLKNCPGWFWLEVRRPDAFFSRGAVGLAAFVHIDAPTQATCAVPYELDFQDSPSINLLKTELVLIKSGTFNGIGQFVPCSGLPIVNIGAVGQLIYGINPIRFGTPIVNGVSMSFDAYLTSPPPQ